MPVGLAALMPKVCTYSQVEVLQTLAALSNETVNFHIGYFTGPGHYERYALTTWPYGDSPFPSRKRSLFAERLNRDSFERIYVPRRISQNCPWAPACAFLVFCKDL